MSDFILDTSETSDPPSTDRRDKKGPSSNRIWDFGKLVQTDLQARHAFASYQAVDVFGAILALDDCWTYREYDQENLRPSPTPSECLDPTFGFEEISALCQRQRQTLISLLTGRAWHVFKRLNLIKPCLPSISI